MPSLSRPFELCCALQAALLAFGSMAAALPFTALFFIAVCLVWVKATLSLAKTMESHEGQKQVSG